MKNNKGISMITLVITIICMIIFLGIAYRIGSRYIATSKEEERFALVSIMSDAVERRQNDRYVGVGGNEVVYSGYHMTSGDFTEASKLFESNDTPYEPGLWYVLDAKAAEELGITGAEEFLIADLQNPSEDEGKNVAIVDYFTGKVEIVDYEEAKTPIDNTLEGDDGHIHTATVVSCKEPSVCTTCGTILSAALGHSYNHTNATCTEDMKCIRCGYIAEKATGHNYDADLHYNEQGHFNQCINEFDGQVCGAIGNFEYHIKRIGLIADSEEWKHTVACDKVGCGYVGEEDCVKDVKAKSTTKHTIYCRSCLKEEDVNHDVIKCEGIDKEIHRVYCDTCKTDLREEDHEDVNIPYGICDKCNAVMDMEKAPEITSLTMVNTTPTGVNEYWAKKSDVIQITMKASMMLSIAPTIEIQGIKINADDIENTEGTTWVATINLQEYSFTDGVLDNIKVSNIRSIWGVVGENLSATTDDKYITFDSTNPEYSIIEE